MASENINSRGIGMVVWIWFSTIGAFLVMFDAMKLQLLANRCRQSLWLFLRDVLVIVSMVSLIAGASLFTVSFYYGMGRYEAEIAYDHTVLAVKYSFVASPLVLLAQSLPNTVYASDLLERHAPLRSHCKVWNALFFGVVLGQTVIAAAAIALLFTQTSPVEALWDYTIPSKDRSPQVLYIFTTFTAVYTIITEILLAVVHGFLTYRTPLSDHLALVYAPTGLIICAAIFGVSNVFNVSEFGNIKDFTHGTVPFFMILVSQAALAVSANSIYQSRTFLSFINQARGFVNFIKESQAFAKMVKWLIGCSCGFMPTRRGRTVAPNSIPLQNMAASMATGTPEGSAPDLGVSFINNPEPGVSYEAKIWSDLEAAPTYAEDDTNIYVTTEFSVTHEPNPHYDPDKEERKKQAAAERKRKAEEREANKQAGHSADPGAPVEAGTDNTVEAGPSTETQAAQTAQADDPDAITATPPVEPDSFLNH